MHMKKGAFEFIHSFIWVSPLKIRNTSKNPLYEGPLHFEVTQLHNAHGENVQKLIWIASPHKLIHIDFPFIFMSKEQCHVTLRNKSKCVDFIQHLVWRVSFRPHFCSSVHFWYKLIAVAISLWICSLRWIEVPCSLHFPKKNCVTHQNGINQDATRYIVLKYF